MNKRVYYAMNRHNQFRFHVKGSPFMFEMCIEAFPSFCGGRIIHSIAVYTDDEKFEKIKLPFDELGKTGYATLRHIQKDLPHIFNFIHRRIRRGVYVLGDSFDMETRYNNSVILRELVYREDDPIPKRDEKLMRARGVQSVFTKPGVFRNSERTATTVPASLLFNKSVRGFRIGRNSSHNSSDHGHEVGLITICKKED
jgi:hypothetical protein